MQHNNPRHEIKFDLLQQLPTTLLLSWSNLQFLTQIHPNLSFDLLDLTIDLLVFLLQNLAFEHSISFCGFLACRRCLRSIKELHLSQENQALLYYITCLVFRVKNEGAQRCPTDIPNSSVRPYIVIPNQETSTEALIRRGLPIQFSTAPSTTQTQTPTSSITSSSSSGTHPRSTSRKRSGGGISSGRDTHCQQPLGNQCPARTVRTNFSSS